MKLLKLIQKSKYTYPAILLFILIAGLFLRCYRLEFRTGFDADQEVLAFRAQEIVKGDLALIGTKTSLGGFSIGPGFYYLAAIFSLVLANNPV